MVNIILINISLKSNCESNFQFNDFSPTWLLIRCFVIDPGSACFVDCKLFIFCRMVYVDTREREGEQWISNKKKTRSINVLALEAWKRNNNNQSSSFMITSSHHSLSALFKPITTAWSCVSKRNLITAIHTFRHVLCLASSSSSMSLLSLSLSLSVSLSLFFKINYRWI